MAECNGCGGFVTDDYVRVFGDNDGNVSECRNCRARSDDAEEESGEREVLLREVTGTTVGDTGQSGSGGGTERPSAGGTTSGDDGSQPATTAEAGSTTSTGRSATTAGNVTPSRNEDHAGPSGEHGVAQEAESTTDSSDGTSGGARERLAGLLSSLRS